MTLPAVLTVAEAADALRCSTFCVYDLIHTGRLREIRVGRLLRVLEDDVVRFIMGDAPAVARVDNVVPIRKGKG